MGWVVGLGSLGFTWETLGDGEKAVRRVKALLYQGIFEVTKGDDRFSLNRRREGDARPTRGRGPNRCEDSVEGGDVSSWFLVVPGVGFCWVGPGRVIWWETAGDFEKAVRGRLSSVIKEFSM